MAGKTKTRVIAVRNDLWKCIALYFSSVAAGFAVLYLIAQIM